MSDQTKLEFADWLKVRDTVEEILQTIGVVDGSGLDSAKHVAEELMAAGLIDTAAILGDDEEVEEDNAEAVEWEPTHLYEYRVGDEITSAPVVRFQALGTTRSMVRYQTGEVDVVDSAFLTPIGSAS